MRIQAVKTQAQQHADSPKYAVRSAWYLWRCYWNPGKTPTFFGRCFDLLPTTLLFAAFTAAHVFHIKTLGFIEIDQGLILRLLAWNLFLIMGLSTSFEFIRNRWLLSSPSHSIFVVFLYCIINGLFYFLLYLALSFIATFVFNTNAGPKELMAVAAAVSLAGETGFFLGFIILPFMLMSRAAIKLAGFLFGILFFCLPILHAPSQTSGWIQMNFLTYPYLTLWNLSENTQPDYFVFMFNGILLACIGLLPLKNIIKMKTSLRELSRYRPES